MIRFNRPLVGTFLALAVLGASARGSDGGSRNPERLLPALDPAGPVDPLDAFECWRRENCVSMPVLPPVWKAHLEWEAAHPPAPAGAALETAVDSSVVNVDLAGGISGYQGEVSVAVNPRDPSHVVSASMTFYADPKAACLAPTSTTYGTEALFGSQDGGATWTYNCAPWPAGATGSVSGAQGMYGAFASVAWDSAGSAYACYQLGSVNVVNRTASSAIVLAKSADAGGTWQPLGVLVNNLDNPALLDDKPLMAVDATSAGAHSHKGRIYVIYDENHVARVSYSDTGLTGTWTTTPLDPGGYDAGCNLAVGADGTVYAIWSRIAGGGTTETAETMAFSKSADGGATWSAPVSIVSPALLSFGNNNNPPPQNKRGVNAFGSLSVDTCSVSPRLGTLYVAYCDFPSGTSSGKDLNIYVVHSTDGGVMWSAPILVNDDGGGTTQFLPSCTVDPSNGVLSVAWYDGRNDAISKKVDVYFSVSTDGGLAFWANRQVTSPSASFANSSVSFSDENTGDNPSYNANQYGDYLGLSAVGGQAIVAWCDTRQYFPTAPPSSALKEDVASAALEETPGGCTLQCSATVPSSADPGATVSFAATSTVTGCGGAPSYDWDFGDGSAHATDASTTHVYPEQGSYQWTLTVTVPGGACTRSGGVRVGNPPVVTAVVKAGSPFRFTVSGSNLQSAIQVSINGAPWTNLAWKSTSKLVIKGGASLKAAVPKGVATPFTFVNPDGGSTTYTVRW